MIRVIKIGGRPQLDPKLPAAVAAAFRAAPTASTSHDHGRDTLSHDGLIVVHGGGDEVSTLQKLYGTTAQFRDGRRVTSATDLEIIRMTLSGSANKRIVSSLVSLGVAAIGISGEDANALGAKPLDLEGFGYVGVPATVNTNLIEYLMTGGYLPVISPVSRSTDEDAGVVLNVNGDDAAAKIAIAMHADELLFVSDVEGVLANGEAVKELDPDAAQRLIDDGTAQGGMAAKIRAALAALEGGVERVRISDIAAIEQLGRGTLLSRVGSTCP